MLFYKCFQPYSPISFIEVDSLLVGQMFLLLFWPHFHGPMENRGGGITVIPCESGADSRVGNMDY